MNDIFERTYMLIGGEAMDRLSSSSVAVFGIGGVGSFAAEALARGGVGSISLFDADKVCKSNINRQIIATYDTIGKNKAEVMKQRILSINPCCRAEAYAVFYSAQNADKFDLSCYSYIVDAIDTVSSKLVLAERAKAAGVPIISSMGTGNKLDPTRFEVADIYQTSVCPLARVMRRELKQRGIDSLKVIYSREEPIKPTQHECSKQGLVTGSVSFVPSVAGLIIAGEVIKDIIKTNV